MNKPIPILKFYSYVLAGCVVTAVLYSLVWLIDYQPSIAIPILVGLVVLYLEFLRRS